MNEIVIIAPTKPLKAYGGEQGLGLTILYLVVLNVVFFGLMYAAYINNELVISLEPLEIIRLVLIVMGGILATLSTLFVLIIIDPQLQRLNIIIRAFRNP